MFLSLRLNVKQKALQLPFLLCLRVTQKALQLSFFSSLFFLLQCFWRDCQKCFACVPSFVAVDPCDQYLMSFLDTLANTLSRETFAGRNFGDFGEFWTYLEKFDPPQKNIFLKKSLMFIRNQLQMPTWWKLKQLIVAWICLKIIKFYQLIIHKSYIFAKNIVTNHSREFIFEILRISSLVKPSPRESFFP